MSRLKDTIIEDNLKVGNIKTDTITSSTINIDDGGGLVTLADYIIRLLNQKILESNKQRYNIGRIIINTSGINPNDYLGFRNLGAIWERKSACRIR